MEERMQQLEKEMIAMQIYSIACTSAIQMAVSIIEGLDVNNDHSANIKNLREFIHKNI